MPKDISQYIDFGDNDGRLPKRSIKSIINLPAIVKSWSVYDSKFRDRVVQRAMCNTGLYHDLTCANIYDNAACQNGKGTSFVMDRLACQLQRHWRKHGHDGWVLRLDIHKFFDSIPHDKLKQMVEQKVKNAEHRKLVYEVIDSFDDPGIGLGSQISQLLAISYLSDFDHLMKEKYGIKTYVRYNDDIVCVHESKEYLQHVRTDVIGILKSLGLELNPKTELHPLKQGIKFLKFKFIITKSGKVLRLLNRSNTVRIRKRLIKLIGKFKQGERQWEDVLNCFNSWKAHAEQGNSYNKIRRIEKWLKVQF